jgi:hypothetical protein
MRLLDSLEIPEFSEYIKTPNNDSCLVIDSTRLMVEILGWVNIASGEFADSTYSRKMLIDGDIALVIRYRREKDNTYRPACAIGFNRIEWGLHIQQLQWSNDKNVAFRFHSSFNTPAFLLKLIEESFIRKWILVTTELFPSGLENASYASRASERYRVFRSGVEWLKMKYENQNR